MRYIVVFDGKGNIVSAGYHDLAEPEALDYLAPRFGPVVEEGQTVAEIEIPDEFARLSLTDFVDKVQVDIKEKYAPLKFKKA